MIVIYMIVCFLLGILIGYFLLRKLLKKIYKESIGVLLIDIGEPEVNGGVYSQFFVDPRTLKDGAIVEMNVMKMDFQEAAKHVE